MIPNHSDHILIVEPDRILRDLMSLALERLDYPVRTADTWSEALERIREHSPRLVLLSMLMPEINGIDALHVLKSNGLLEQTAVIVVTALGYKEVVEQAVKAGASEFIVKPFDIKLLIDKVRRVLEPSQGESI